MKRLITLACVFGLELICFRTFKPVVPAGKESERLEAPQNASQLRIQQTPQRRLIPDHETIDSDPLELPEDNDALRDWAREHPEQALAWLPGADVNERRDIVVEIVCARIAESDPAGAVLLAERYTTASGNLLENLIHQWADQNVAKAKFYALSKSCGPDRDRLLSRVALVEAKINPAEAANLVVNSISPGEIQAEAAISVLHQWALADPDAAAAWATLFPDEGLRDRAINEVAAAKMLVELP